MPLDAILHHETYTQDLSQELEEADQDARDWARETNLHMPATVPKANESRGWTDRMAHLWGGELPPKGRAQLIEHLRALGFGLE